jgi:hypothetical protein
MRPRLSGCGLSRHGMMPSAALANRRAPSTSAGPQAASRAPNTYVQEPLQRTAALKPRVQFAKHRTGSMTTPLPSAAFAVAAARIAPGRGSLSGSPGCRQVMHTYTVAAPVDAAASVRLGPPMKLTRPAPQGDRPDPGARYQSMGPGGTPPGPRPNRRQVSWLAGRRPSPPSRDVVPVATWHGLAAYSCGGSCGLGTLFRTAFPVRSRMRDRRSRPLNGGRRRFVNAEGCALAVDPPTAIVPGLLDSHAGGKNGTR